jgi:hypothetical protein
MWEVICRRTEVQAVTRQNYKTLSEKQKGDVAQIADHLSSKWKDLISVPNAATKPKTYYTE